MVQRISGMSPEKVVQFVERWESLNQFYREAREWEFEVERENERLDREDEEMERQQGGKGKKKVVKRRKVEDFVYHNLKDVGGTRGIKQKLGEKIWEVFMSKDERYTS